MKIKLQLNPSGPGCRHVHVTSDTGALIEVTTESGLFQPVSRCDSVLMKTLKLSLKRARITEKDANAAKTHVEKTDFRVRLSNGGR